MRGLLIEWFSGIPTRFPKWLFAIGFLATEGFPGGFAIFAFLKASFCWRFRASIWFLFAIFFLRGEAFSDVFAFLQPFLFLLFWDEEVKGIGVGVDLNTVGDEGSSG